MTDKQQQGFTLIEILIALLIVSIALAAATTARNHAISNSSHLRDKVFAHWVAENRLTEMRINREFPSTSSKKVDSTSMGQTEWQWEQVVEKTTNKSFRRITINVYPVNKKDDEKPLTFLNSLIINPDQLSPKP